ncbi:MAG: hypothetical protein DRP93_07690 [Candidatus Neomarinimicrobiota bacterium]|nr:MAG: hypothetical protein DRP93_07690 [Candidatus Neomarinimicrobiota bacterium]
MTKYILFIYFLGINIFANETIVIDETMYQNQSFSNMAELTEEEKYSPDLINLIIERMRQMNWSSAKDYCENLEYGNFSDWRLPTHQEFEKISLVKIYYGLGNYKNFDDYAKEHLDKAKKHLASIKQYRIKSKIGSELVVKKEFLENMPLINDQHMLGEFWVLDQRDKEYAMTLDLRNAVAWWTTKTQKAYVLCTRQK